MNGISGMRQSRYLIPNTNFPHLINNVCFRITNPGLADSGTYECQINTEPKRSRLYHLDVVISKVRLVIELVIREALKERNL